MYSQSLTSMSGSLRRVSTFSNTSFIIARLGANIDINSSLIVAISAPDRKRKEKNKRTKRVSRLGVHIWAKSMKKSLYMHVCTVQQLQYMAILKQITFHV